MVPGRSGVFLTEHYAMFPAAAVSVWYFAHPQAQYFAVGKVDKGQVTSYTARKGQDLSVTERWLAPNLGYDNQQPLASRPPLLAVFAYHCPADEIRFAVVDRLPVPYRKKDFVMLQPAQAVHERFATRPTLVSVVFNALRAHYPTLDLLTVKLARPQPSGEYTFKLLLNVVIAHVLDPQPLDLTSHFLTQNPPQRLVSPSVDMQALAEIIDTLPTTLYIHFQQALADYWSDTDSHGSSRWQWLSEWLNGQMSVAATRQSSLTDAQRETLSIVATWPDTDKRLPRATPAVYAYFIETTLTTASQQVQLLTPDLLLVRDKQVLLYPTSGAVECYDGIDAFSTAWGARMHQQFAFDSLTWRRNEPDGNVFERQAGLILNQQLEDLGNLSFQGSSEEDLEARLNKITDPALQFASVLPVPDALAGKLSSQFPNWLKQANADDRFAYHRHLQDMAQVVKKNQGRSFNEGIETLHGFTRDALRKQMLADHADFDPDHLILDFAVAAGYPGGAGFITHVRMTLTELAVKNLAGKPKGTPTLSQLNNQPLPTWLTEDYLLGSDGLIQRVDIGTAYPRAIRDLLLSDSVDARRREQLFVRELKAKLPMQALEFKIRQQNGLTTTGYRYVKALMGESPSDRIVKGEEVVLRPLALCRKAEAIPDRANNLFIIESRNPGTGPHLLYRPLYTDCLYEYPTRQALLDALAAPGELQDSVLTWLTDRARPVYAQGGFKEPHIVHFLQGDEFSFARTPAPATLAVDDGAQEWLQSQVNGQLLNHLFGSTARALVDLADRESVSNHESRWAIVMEGAWLLFNTLLLPLVRGPAMLAGWFVVLVSSVEQDFAGLDSDDPTTRELALIDLLLNCAMVLLHASAPKTPLKKTKPGETRLRLASWMRPAQDSAAQRPPAARQGSVALPGEPPASGRTALDFTRSLASPQAAANLQQALLSVKVPWPKSLPAAEASGPLKGLYRIGDTWHASVGGLLFQVSVVPGFGEVYVVHPRRPHHPGFKLTRDDQGHWRLDRRARLEGGMPRERLSEWQKQHDEQVKGLRAELAALGNQLVADEIAASPLLDAVNAARIKLVEQKKTLRQVWLLLGRALPALREKVANRHQREQQLTANAKAEFDIAVDHYQQDAQRRLPITQQHQAKAEQLMAIDRSNPKNRRMRDIAVNSIAGYWGSLYDIQLQKLSDTSETARGENYGELSDRSSQELQANVNDAYQEMQLTWREQFKIFKEMATLAQKIETILRQADPALRKFLTAERPDHAVISSVSIKQSLLLFLSELVFDRSQNSREPVEYPFVMELSDPKRDKVILSHAEVRETTGYTVSEESDVLKSVLELYERLENAVTSLSEMGSSFVREEYRAPFLEHLHDARTSLETHLADLILANEGFASLPASTSSIRRKLPGKIVFKTRGQDTLVGNLRAASPDIPGRLVDIQDAVTKMVVATYLEHAQEGVWVEVVPAEAPRPAPAPLVRTVDAIAREAQTVMARRAGIERTIRAQQKKLQDPTRREEVRPLEWDEMLTPQANQLAALADELQGDHPNATALIESYREASSSLLNLAREVCSEGYKQQRPKAANVAYLWKYGFVDINLVRRRVQLKAGDFLTEYAIRDKSAIVAGKKPEETVLWYAHFHYPSADTSAFAPTFGHLKTREERLFTRKELIEQARSNNRQVVNLEKAVIYRPLDRELFLNLEPPKR